jgi:Ni,Fe-hydrogenase III small subunit
VPARGEAAVVVRVVPGPVAAVPADGVLEELDGRPIGQPSVRGLLPGDALPGPGVPWRRGAAAATAMTARWPSLWVYALVAFLARGGIVVLALPIVVAPTFIGLANFVGPASVSAGGPGPRLIALLVVGLAAAAVLVVVGACVAAAAEVALHRATAATPEARTVVAIGRGAGAVFAEANADADAAAGMPTASAPRTGPQDAGDAGTVRAIARVAGVRLILLVPVVIVAAVAIPAWVAVAYRELTVPSDVSAPLATRVLAGAPVASVAVLGAWLAAEIVGGFAARRSSLLEASIPRALHAGFVDPFRAPLATALTVTVALGVTVLALVATWWVTGVAWDAARQALGGGLGALAALGAALLMAVAWLAGLVLAAGAAAWRATLVTMELLRR